MKKQVFMKRSQSLSNDVVLIDGMSGSGKTLIAPLVSSLNRGELWLMNPIYEYLCTADWLGQLERSAGAAIVQLMADTDLYNLRVGRNVNFRSTDLSSAAMNFMEEKYRDRILNSKEGDEAVALIRENRPILPLMTHYIFGISDLLFEAFHERLKAFILPVRHPLWLIESWYKGNFHARIPIDPRDFQQCVQAGEDVVPWFAKDWPEEYRKLGRLEQAIAVVVELDKQIESKLKTLSAENKNKVLTLIFEDFVTNPDPFMAKILQKLQTTETEFTARMKAGMKVPRVLPEDYFKAQAAKIEEIGRQENVSPAWQKKLEQLCAQYEARYGWGMEKKHAVR